jgi:TonB-dependent starch-binding outer membrane protein SusC
LTGQQNVSDNYYPYLATYTTSSADDAKYQFGSSSYYLIRPDAYNATLKWETTTTYNIGVDFGILNNRFTGSVDVYKRVTNDLLNTVTIAAGTNFTNKLISNIGSLENKGIEITLNGRAYQSKAFNWDLSYNLAHNANKVTKLNRGSDSDGVKGTSISGGTGNTICITQVGYPVNSYYVKKQVYDKNGMPIEGAYADNGALYISSHTATPDVTMGLSSRMTYKNWYLNFAMRASIGNYNYNNVESRLAFKSTTYDSSGFLKNTLTAISNTNFSTAQFFSDYYIQNASFLKMDNVSLGYTFDKVIKEIKSITVYGTVQNIFTITKYKGLDPEVDGGIDNNVYPRPRVFMLGLRVNL